MVAAAIPFLFAAFRSSRVDAWIGSLTYPFYLAHMFVIDCFWMIERPYRDALAFLSTLLLSIALVKLVEEPIERVRARVVRSSAPRAGA